MGTGITDVVGVGAGIAGLSCARELVASGASVVLLERSAGVGGRCATRRVHDQPVDHGAAFLHGADPTFLDAVRSVAPASPMSWPTRLQGTGLPCNPRAFDAGQCCMAYAEGISAFPKSLAAGIDVRRGQRVAALERHRGAWRAFMEDGTAVVARRVFLAMPVEQAAALLRASGGASEVAARALPLLSLVGTVPCLTVLAGYPLDVPEPPWHIAYPGESDVLQLVSHDSSKRRSPRYRVLVLQARPAWSAAGIEAATTPAAWATLLLEEAARLYGTWIRTPAWSEAHRWMHARLDVAQAFARPLVVPSEGGGMFGLAGEAFDAAGGLEGAFTSGLALARALQAEG